MQKEKIKILVVGDVHGTEHWLNHDFSRYDKVISLGDWYDDWRNDWSKVNQIENQKRFIELKHKNPDKFILLIGNHSFQYLAGETYSGKQFNKEIDIREFLFQHLKEFKLVHQEGDYLFSHAGVSQEWCDFWKMNDIKTMNGLLQGKIYGPLSYFPYDMSMNGEDVHQSPIWIRPLSLSKTPWRNYNQVVGHTAVREGYSVETKLSNGKKLFIVDNQEHTAYLELEI